MNKAPAFQFYVKDWLSSKNVICMTPEQRGAYIQLMCHAWNSDRQGTLPNDDNILAVLSGLNGRWEKVGDPVKKMFKISGSLLYHPRLVEERKKQKVRSDQCRKAGKASADKRLGVPTSVQHKANTSSSSSTASSPSLSIATNKENVEAFDKFWEAYPRKVAKQETFTYWKKNVTNYQAIMDSLKVYKKDFPTKDQLKFMRHPKRFISNDFWRSFMPEEIDPSKMQPEVRDAYNMLLNKQE